MALYFIKRKTNVLVIVEKNWHDLPLPFSKLCDFIPCDCSRLHFLFSSQLASLLLITLSLKTCSFTLTTYSAWNIPPSNGHMAQPAVCLKIRVSEMPSPTAYIKEHHSLPWLFPSSLSGASLSILPDLQCTICNISDMEGWLTLSRCPIKLC